MDLETMTDEELEAASHACMAERAAIKERAAAIDAERTHRAQVAAFAKAGGDPAQVLRPSAIPTGERVGTPG